MICSIPLHFILHLNGVDMFLLLFLPPPMYVSFGTPLAQGCVFPTRCCSRRWKTDSEAQLQVLRT